jgi:RNA polymerase sigma factor (sigma-70 family)
MCTHRHYLEENWSSLRLDGLRVAAIHSSRPEDCEDAVTRATIRFISHDEHTCRHCVGHSCMNDSCSHCYQHPCHRCHSSDGLCNSYCPGYCCCRRYFLNLVRCQIFDLNREARRSRERNGLDGVLGTEATNPRHGSIYEVIENLAREGIPALGRIIPGFSSSHGHVLHRLINRDISSEDWQKVLSEGMKVAIRILGNDVDAGEAVGKATEKVITSETEPDNLGPYFVQVVRNEARRIYTRRKGRLVISGGEWDWSDEGDAIAEIDEAEALEIALQDLPEADRTILRMRFWEDLSHEEIAEELDIPVTTARQRYSRAMKKLRDMLKEPCLVH